MKPSRAIYRTCADCGKEFVISPKFQDYIEENGLKLPKRCQECRSRRKESYEVKVCVDCGAEFTITQNEHKFYSERGLTEPKRCQECRVKKHERNTKETQPE